MRKNTYLFFGILIAFVIMAATACSVEVAPLNTATRSNLEQEVYDDPFAYCGAAGTVDLPNDRYTGPQITDEIINGYKSAAGLEDSTEPMDNVPENNHLALHGRPIICL